MRLYNKLTANTILLLSASIPALWALQELRPLLWTVSWYSVVMVMLIRPLSDLFTAQKWLKRLIPYRKEFGILSASVVVSNAFFTYIPMGGSFFGYYFSASYWDFRTPFAYGHLSELVGFILLMTSNRFSMRHMKRWWKRVQRSSYIYFYGAAVFLVAYGKTDVLISASFIALLGSLAAFKRRGWWPQR